MNNQIDIGIINYNGGDCLLKCIQSIKEMTGAIVNLYVLDNKSSDNSIELVEKEFPDCTLIRSERNLGYAGGCNLLLKYFTSDIIAVCNMDLEFTPDWAKNVLSSFEHNPDAYSIASLVIQKDTNEIYASDIHFYWDLHPMCIVNKSDTEAERQVFGAYGAVMTFRRETFERIGYFDDDYFLFFEETEFFLRMNTNNLKVFLCPFARVYHHRSTSTVRYSSLKLFYSERNRIWTALKYLPLWYIPLLFPISLFRLYFMSVNGVPKQDGNGKKIKASAIIITILKAWLVSFSKIFRELRKRKKIWSGTSLTPLHTIDIIKKYNLSRSQLHIK